MRETFSNGTKRAELSKNSMSLNYDTNFLNCLLIPHILVSTKQTCLYVEDCTNIRSKFSKI